MEVQNPGAALWVDKTPYGKHLSHTDLISHGGLIL